MKPALCSVGGGGTDHIFRNIVLHRSNLFLLHQIFFLLPGLLLFFELQILGISAFITGQSSPLYLTDAGHQFIQEIPVMGHNQQRTFVILEITFQPHQRFKIQMIGGFVQDQQRGLFQQQSCNGQPGLFSAAEGIDHRVKGFIPEPHAVEDGFDLYIHKIALILGKLLLNHRIPRRKRLIFFSLRLMIQRRHRRLQLPHLPGTVVLKLKNLSHLLHNGTAPGKAGILFQKTEGHIPSRGNLPFVRLFPSNNQLEQGRFSCAVDSDQPNSVVILYLQINILQHLVPCKSF